MGLPHVLASRRTRGAPQGIASLDVLLRIGNVDHKGSGAPKFQGAQTSHIGSRYKPRGPDTGIICESILLQDKSRPRIKQFKYQLYRPDTEYRTTNDADRAYEVRIVLMPVPYVARIFSIHIGKPRGDRDACNRDADEQQYFPLAECNYLRIHGGSLPDRV